MLYIVPLVISFGFVSIKDEFSPAALKRAIITRPSFCLRLSVYRYISAEAAHRQALTLRNLFLTHTLFF